MHSNAALCIKGPRLLLIMKRKELFWMLVPCLLFAGVAFWMRAREARMPSDGKFHLVIEKIETPPISAKDAADGYDTEVAVTLNFIGPKPAWWSQQSGGFGSSDQRECLFYEAEGSPKGKGKPAKIAPDFKNNPTIFYWRPSWNKSTSRYDVRFFLPLSKLPSRREQTVLRFPIAIEDGSVYPHKNLCEPVPLIFTVRQPKQIVKPADAPRNPLLEIVTAEVIKPTAAQQKTNGGYDTEVELQLQYLGSKDDTGAATGSDSVIDENGNPIIGGPGWRTSSGQSGNDQDHPILKYQLRLTTIPQTQRNVFVRLKYSRGDHWPLTVRVPLRENGTDLSGIVKAKPESTR